MKIILNTLTLSALVLTSACSDYTPTGNRESNRKLVKSCVSESGAPGAYSAPTNTKVPKVTHIPKLGGTQDGANRINACIQRKAASGDQMATTQHPDPKTARQRILRENQAPTVTGFCPRGAATIHGGSIYCIKGR